MKIIKNEKLIKRNGQIASWVFMAAFIILGGGLYLNVTNIRGENIQFVSLTLVAFVVGYILLQVWFYLGRRYGGRPRVDEKLDASLKGLPGDYTIYHFMAPTSHLLVGAAGVWVLLPYHQRGTVAYLKNRWRILNGGLLQGYMSIFGQDGIGRPDLEAEGEIGAVRKYLAKSLDENQIPAIQAVLIFTNENMEIQANDAPVPAIKIKQLKDFMRQKAKEKPISQTQLTAVKAALPE